LPVPDGVVAVVMLTFDGAFHDSLPELEIFTRSTLSASVAPAVRPWRYVKSWHDE
jgi:hypothetical protein